MNYNEMINKNINEIINKINTNQNFSTNINEIINFVMYSFCTDEFIGYYDIYDAIDFKYVYKNIDKNNKYYNFFKNINKIIKIIKYHNRPFDDCNCKYSEKYYNNLLNLLENNEIIYSKYFIGLFICLVIYGKCNSVDKKNYNNFSMMKYFKGYKSNIIYDFLFGFYTNKYSYENKRKLIKYYLKRIIDKNKDIISSWYLYDTNKYKYKYKYYSNKYPQRTWSEHTIYDLHIKKNNILYILKKK